MNVLVVVLESRHLVVWDGAAGDAAGRLGHDQVPDGPARVRGHLRPCISFKVSRNNSNSVQYNIRNIMENNSIFMAKKDTPRWGKSSCMC